MTCRQGDTKAGSKTQAQARRIDAFARQLGQEDGQVFAIAVMAVAASEVVVGLGLIVAMGRRNLELDVDKFRTLRG